MIRYLFGDIPASSDYKNHVLRAAAGIDGAFGDGWTYSVSGTIAHSWLDMTQNGYLNLAGLTNAINNGTYNFVDPTQNSSAVRNALSPSVHTQATTDLDMIQGVITKEVMQLPGGPLQVGVGGSFRYEAQNDPNQNPNLTTLGLNQFSAIGHRTVESGYFEINAPILNSLEIDGSGRYDHYQEGYNRFSPKIGVKFMPIQQLALRGTFSKGFRAPSFAETSGTVIGFTSSKAPCAIQVQRGAGNIAVGVERTDRGDALLVRDRGEQPRPAIGEGVAEQPEELRRHLLAVALIQRLAGEDALELLERQRTRRLDVDRRADTAALKRGLRALIDLRAADQFGRDQVEGESAIVIVRREAAAVEQHGVEGGAEAAHADRLAFAIAAVDRDAGNALQRLGDIGVGKFPEILGRDGVENAGRIALYGGGRFDAAADAGDDDIGGGAVRLGLAGESSSLIGGRCLGLRQGRCGGDKCDKCTGQATHDTHAMTLFDCSSLDHIGRYVGKGCTQP